ncbi:MAG TPA: GntR family transcriptional regulator [Actinoplanes sp.]
MPGSRRRSVLTSRLAGSVLGNPQGTVLDQLRRCILDGEVPPGSAIPVDDVAAVCGVSRIPVREALMTLIGEGLVDHRAHAGYRVAQLTAQELTEIYLVREALEATALRYAVEQATPGDHDLAREAHADLERAVVAGDPRAHHRESRRSTWH